MRGGRAGWLGMAARRTLRQERAEQHGDLVKKDLKVLRAGMTILLTLIIRIPASDSQVGQEGFSKKACSTGFSRQEARGEKPTCNNFGDMRGRSEGTGACSNLRVKKEPLHPAKFLTAGWSCRGTNPFPLGMRGWALAEGKSELRHFPSRGRPQSTLLA